MNMVKTFKLGHEWTRFSVAIRSPIPQVHFQHIGHFYTPGSHGLCITPSTNEDFLIEDLDGEISRDFFQRLVALPVELRCQIYQKTFLPQSYARPTFLLPGRHAIKRNHSPLALCHAESPWDSSLGTLARIKKLDFDLFVAIIHKIEKHDLSGTSKLNSSKINSQPKSQTGILPDIINWYYENTLFELQLISHRDSFLTQYPFEPAFPPRTLHRKNCIRVLKNPALYSFNFVQNLAVKFAPEMANANHNRANCLIFKHFCDTVSSRQLNVRKLTIQLYIMDDDIRAIDRAFDGTENSLWDEQCWIQRCSEMKFQGTFELEVYSFSQNVEMIKRLGRMLRVLMTPESDSD